MEEKLIEFVRERKILYDTNPDYMRTKLKMQLWEEVAKEIDLPNGNEAKAVWEKLRHSLRDALRRQDKYSKSGAPAEAIKLWKFQKQMGFLQPYMSNRPRNLINDPNETANLNSTSNSAHLGTNNNLEESEEQQIMDPEMPMNNDEPEAHLEFATPRPKKKLQKDSVVTLLKQSMARREERSKERTIERAKLMEQRKSMEIPTNDAIYHFFMSMYEMTKAMPPSAQHNVRNSVYSAVTQMEALLLNITPTYGDNQFSSDHYQTTYHHMMGSTSNSSSSSIPADSSHSYNLRPSSTDNFKSEANSSDDTSQNQTTLLTYVNDFDCK